VLDKFIKLSLLIGVGKACFTWNNQSAIYKAQRAKFN
jgi:hypothetical protein